jgi:hypothetical protein
MELEHPQISVTEYSWGPRVLSHAHQGMIIFSSCNNLTAAIVIGEKTEFRG